MASTVGSSSQPSSYIMLQCKLNYLIKVSVVKNRLSKRIGVLHKVGFFHQNVYYISLRKSDVSERYSAHSVHSRIIAEVLYVLMLLS